MPVRTKSAFGRFPSKHQMPHNHLSEKSKIRGNKLLIRSPDALTQA